MNQSEIDAERYIVGRRALIEAIEADTAIEKIFLAFGNEDAGPIAQIRSQASKANIQCAIMDRRKFQALEKQLGLAPNDAQGVIAIRPVKAPVTLETLLKGALDSSPDPIIIVLDGITDPHNLGAIARSAEGAGAYGMILPIKYSAPVTPVAVKASAGALEHLPVAKVPRVSEMLKQCKAEGWRIIGTAVPATSVYTDDIYSGPLIIVIGNEGEGLHPSVQAVCDVLVEIPMMGHVASLNASVAAGIVLFEARSRRVSPNRQR
ncbi:MAG: 23S rRNA (guanosine(2251)-2'-O)-methyltransferase RlmB [Ignavibacteria bacterium]|nr:23S rRNA (guanosine(2251)-2'-O)-methyltransferase RlmB [Ignavibacteria bacterium]MBP6509745.1 23S rRNA (guanosine(2251)-2'-O)-methyltransferase RlmB [Candidatus Kapabacteria bacterium]MBK6419059.1 23S rRNA (guanosine(2251)-2'-O)-methyltransferase RlmB [Ignavibacteria bacterium]MBK6760255.1 23S rRNA (guanosine(2251)-2'-O)-methyltransferase RlmB [Ignavibacteria bacterium]MBK7034003.1 23S rRNA (guanosine(2251)-2'-O)-methyltransferase RlmB [Ignavibacteria bacterium]